MKIRGRHLSSKGGDFPRCSAPLVEDAQGCLILSFFKRSLKPNTDAEIPSLVNVGFRFLKIPYRTKKSKSCTSCEASGLTLFPEPQGRVFTELVSVNPSFSNSRSVKVLVTKVSPGEKHQGNSANSRPLLEINHARDPVKGS